jgi:hypothetical protein
VGNDFGNEVFAGRYDASTGLILLGDGKGGFEVVPSSKSNFYVGGDAKSLVKLYNSKGDELLIASQNRDSLRTFVKVHNNSIQVLDVGPLDLWAELQYTNGKKQRVEFYYGSGHLSQSSRKLSIPRGVKEAILHDSKGDTRKVFAEGM